MNRKTFNILSWTWGLPMTLLGALVFLVLQIFGHKPKSNVFGYYIEIGDLWGGMTMGPYCVCEKTPGRAVLSHEFGHSVQNCYFGPFQILISIASAIRYQYRNFLVRNGKNPEELPDYDSAWYEAMATELGRTYTMNNR